MFNSTFKRTAVAAAIAMGLSGAAMAQDTSSNLRGSVTTQSGEFLPNTKIQLRNERTGTVQTYTTNEQGAFAARGLSVGGPYTIVAEGPEGRTEVIEDIYLTLGDSESVRIVLKSEMEKIQVTGAPSTNSLYGSNSPAANFNLSDLQNSPAINRDLKDIVRVDPRVYVSAGDSIQCMGAHPRFNSLTVDGARMNDNFGLNSGGYPTRSMPFSYDAIEQVAVEFAPFDVQYGGFTACNINAVTKSGQNELFGGFFYDYASDSLQGDKLEGEDITIGDFSEDRFGFNVGGAIIEDKLFFFAAYEKLEGESAFSYGAADSNAGTRVNGVNQAQLDQIRQIAQDVYGYDVGSPVTSSPVEDEKLLLKLDWNISDAHRASLTYNKTEDSQLNTSDQSGYEYEFSNHYYTIGNEFTSYIGQVYSDWTDRFSTEVRVGYSKLDNSQITVGPQNIADFQIDTKNDHDGDGTPSDATVYFGADDSRQANDLDYETMFYKLAGTYFLGDHVISGGIEREEYDVFNMFVQHSRGGEIDFASLQDFIDGNVETYYYGNATGTEQNPRNAAGEFSYATNTAYLQDEYYYSPLDMTVTFGLRYDWYESSDYPQANQEFEDIYGFTNSSNLDGKGLLQPRLGVNWNVSPDLELRGGIGLYSGGNPNVWLANNYQQDGISQTQTRMGNFNLFELAESGGLIGEGRPGYDVPQALYDDVVAGRATTLNVLDPNFDIPSEWKYALGATYTLPGDYIWMTDLMYSVRKDEAYIKNIAVEPVGEMADGRPIYDVINEGRDTDLMLSNLNQDSKVASISTSISKSYDFGLDLALAYAYVDSEDGNPMTSSVAQSNFQYFATDNFNNPSPATSNYEIPHRFTFRATYSNEFFDGYATTIGLFASANKGRPYSYVMGNATYKDGDDTITYPKVQGVDVAEDGRQLLYVPDGRNDPNVVFGPNFDQDAFFSWLEGSGAGKYAGGSAGRNAFNSDWWTKVDLRVEQELPGLMDGHKASLFFTIDNLTNLLNDDWGVLNESIYGTATVVDAYRDSQGRYVFDSFSQPNPQSRITNASLWQARIGIEYKF
ncbi:carboxypeptidase regulatory-like domain-containing protein [Idiomarina sp. M1R2S28]|uniref:Carboxypeptidase regulatory-like domain-containing protein n=1 Tax=Idiomarina rhizosphaerae TaxID=2961572 RepID=A0A9X2FTY2_9GAMM|nr:TonB-dependent receptor [Idiomarina rhizosphaerae]MCP1338522.1 carboxypeptidase regulatory-like domain-containing protein [Idiomarina rhizosphaerae]